MAKFVAVTISLFIIIAASITHPASGDEYENCNWIEFSYEGRPAIGCFEEGSELPLEDTVTFLDEEIITPPLDLPDPPVAEPEDPEETTNPKDPTKPEKPKKDKDKKKKKKKKDKLTWKEIVDSGGFSPSFDYDNYQNPSKKEPGSEEITTQTSAEDLNLFNPGSFDIQEADLSEQTLDSIDFPVFLLPIYQACGSEYNIPWEILASINRIETDFGRLNKVTSSAGAQGWMQFMPSTWDMYGTDANRDKKADPYNPVDAICSAARYLKAAGFEESVYNAVFAYNHADWYVADVLEGARQYKALPRELVDALSALASPSTLPLETEKTKLVKNTTVKRLKMVDENKIGFVRSVADAKVESVGVSKKFGRYVLLKDDFGNRFLYSGLSEGPMPQEFKPQAPKNQEKIRANETRREDQKEIKIKEKESEKNPLKKKGKTSDKKNPKKKAKGKRGIVQAGQPIARIKDSFYFSVRPAGTSSPWINPASLLSNWKTLDRAAFSGLKQDKIKKPSSSQIFLMSKPALAEKVLSDERISLYECDRDYIQRGFIDRRVLALLATLANDGYNLGISSLLCGRESSITVTGNASNHSFGRGVDIASINGESVFGNQAPGSLTEEVVLRTLGFQGSMQPDELISLFDFGGPSWSDPVDHADHIHVGYSAGPDGGGDYGFLNSKEWKMIVEKISELNKESDIKDVKTEGGSKEKKEKKKEGKSKEKKKQKLSLKEKSPKKGR